MIQRTVLHASKKKSNKESSDAKLNVLRIGRERVDVANVRREVVVKEAAVVGGVGAVGVALVDVVGVPVQGVEVRALRLTMG